MEELEKTIAKDLLDCFRRGNGIMLSGFEARCLMKWVDAQEAWVLVTDRDVAIERSKADAWKKKYEDAEFKIRNLKNAEQ